ncbi:hypothetical protein SAMN05216368_11365 [Cryobacterium flavum]|uniref:Putative T7SS secretion signal domain-containing protein n=1 Tax=Cryobacterium flavum TaxID=1424659 RepID=A0A4V3I962_9MICO|nr:MULTISPECIES: hypothetical protein [Cryobacterium]TFB78006.1 hypothetical protein E3O21_06995 [Cryobacterium flavum]SDO25407.1 hypothetical protein SAMN05216368_11365 [Cryobacterium flavum]
MRSIDWTPVNLGSDPVPGEPGIVQSGGLSYLEVADAIRSAERRLRNLDAGGSVVSEAVEALQETANTVADNILRAEKRYRAVGQALLDYAPQLESAQQESQSALESARIARDTADESSAHQRHYLRLAADDTDPVQALMYTNVAETFETDAVSASAGVGLAITRINDAVTSRDRGAETARGSIENITSSDDLNDGWWDNWGKDALAVITDIAGWVSAIAGVLALLVSWIPVVGQLLAAALLVVAGLAAVVNAIGNIVLASSGERSWGEAGLSIAGVALSFIGMGAAVKVVGRVLMAEKVTMKVGQQITVKQSLRLRPADWKQWAGDMRTPVPPPVNGQTIWRAYGGKANATGGSWSPVDVQGLSNPRMQMGLPGDNGMSRVVVARLDDVEAVQTLRHGLPYEGNLGGAPEYRIPWDAQGKITVLNDLPFVVP